MFAYQCFRCMSNLATRNSTHIVCSVFPECFILLLPKGNINRAAHFLLQSSGLMGNLHGNPDNVNPVFLHMSLCVTCNLSAGVYHSSLPRQQKSQILLCQWAAFRFTQVLLEEEPHSQTHTHKYTHADRLHWVFTFIPILQWDSNSLCCGYV